MTPAEFVGEIVARETAWLESLLRQLAVGETLCVHRHHAAYDRPDGAWGEGCATRAALTAHTLGVGARCRVQTPARKTQYGPMTAEVLAALHERG